MTSKFQRDTISPKFFRNIELNARIAQLVEHLLAMQKVAGSSPVSRSEKALQPMVVRLFY